MESLYNIFKKLNIRQNLKIFLIYLLHIISVVIFIILHKLNK